MSAQHAFTEVIPISATKGKGLDILVEKLIEHLPVGERYFPKDQFTDQPERFMVAELIREKILLETGEEVPYASAVVVEKFEEPPPPPKNPRPLKAGQLPPKLPVTKIAAAIYCEREGQKAILIGKGGAKLKAIGTAARKEIESLLGTRVFLELFVVVEENWRESRGFLATLDWRNQLEELAKKESNSAVQVGDAEELRCRTLGGELFLTHHAKAREGWDSLTDGAGSSRRLRGLPLIRCDLQRERDCRRG